MLSPNTHCVPRDQVLLPLSGVHLRTTTRYRYYKQCDLTWKFAIDHQIQTLVWKRAKVAGNCVTADTRVLQGKPQPITFFLPGYTAGNRKRSDDEITRTRKLMMPENCSPSICLCHATHENGKRAMRSFILGGSIALYNDFDEKQLERSRRL